MLHNGFGEHNIQGIGDKHVPLIHNVMNTDVALAVSDRATDRLGVLFGTDAGRGYLRGAAACRTTSLDGAALARALEHLQRPRRDQDREALRPRAGRRRRHGRDRRRSDVRQRARPRARPVLPRRVRRGRGGGGLRRAPARRGDRQPARADARGARADLQPRLLHLGRAAGRLARGLRGAARSRLLDARARAGRRAGTS